MANIIGSILGKPVGKTGGVVFGGARSRTGKITTVRSFVPPSNPNTILQQQQRSKFAACQDIVRRLGPTVYRDDFNRAIGQLPGFQSMNSIFLNQMDSELFLELTMPINLGTLHAPSTLSIDFGGTGGAPQVHFSTENGENGTQNDIIKVLFIASEESARTPAAGVQVGQAVRSAGLITLAAPPDAVTYYCYVYAKGAGIAEGMLSVANIVSGQPLSIG